MVLPDEYKRKLENMVPVQLFGINAATEQLQPISKDTIFDGVRTISNAHAEIHDGDGFAASEQIDTTSQDSTFDIRFVTPDQKQVHLRNYEFDVTTAPGEVQLFEGADLDADGTDINPHAVNRPKSDNTDFETEGIVQKNPTVNGTGTELEVSKVTGQKQSGGQGVSELEEWVLKAGTPYLIRYTNRSTSDAEGSFTLWWYEHGRGETGWSQF